MTLLLNNSLEMVKCATVDSMNRHNWNVIFVKDVCGYGVKNAFGMSEYSKDDSFSSCFNYL